MLLMLLVGAVAIVIMAPQTETARSLRRAARGFLRIAAGLWAAVCAATIADTVVRAFGGSFWAGRSTAGWLGMAAFVLVLWVTRQTKTMERFIVPPLGDLSHVQPPPVAAANPTPAKPVLFTSPTAAQRLAHTRRTVTGLPSDPALAGSWRTLALLADGAESRVAVVRASCERYLAAVGDKSWDGEVSEWALFIRRNLPALVESCAVQWRIATSSERETLTEELLDSLEQIGAKADRLREHARKMAETDFDIQRAHIARQSAPDPFSDGARIN
jgi:hypothetical protein